MAGIPRVVIDTNVLVAASRSRLGTSFQLISRVGKGRFDISLSVPLVLEYEEALLRHLGETRLTGGDVEDVLDYFCSVGHLQEIFYLWRPFLPDPKDDLVLEVAIAGNCEAIITFNRKDFHGAARFGIKVLEPAKFLKNIGVL